MSQIYSGVPLASLAEALAAAQAALPLLERGESVASIATADQRIAFVPSSPALLRQSIRDLQLAIAIAQGQPPRGMTSTATWTRGGRGSSWDC